MKIYPVILLSLFISTQTSAENTDFLRDSELPKIFSTIKLKSIGTRDFETLNFKNIEKITGSKFVDKASTKYLCVNEGTTYLYIFETIVSNGYYISNTPLREYPVCHKGNTKTPFSKIFYPGQAIKEIESMLAKGAIKNSVLIKYEGPVQDEDCAKRFFAYENLYIEFEQNFMKRAYYTLSGEPLDGC